MISHGRTLPGPDPAPASGAVQPTDSGSNGRSVPPPGAQTEPRSNPQSHPAADPGANLQADLEIGPTQPPELSVIVKTLNEAAKIAACLRSVLAATDAATTEVIVADSLSDDATVEVASRFPVRIVQLARLRDRGCGSAAQLGFQYARGRRVLVLDGDMELTPGFLPAAQRALDAEPKLAGVGGLVIDRVMTLEFQRRNRQDVPNSRPGIHDHLSGGGLFRMEALRQSGYLTDRNLHACEELELGMRLSALGWQFRRLDLPSVYHYGHATPPFRLLLNRWRTKYVFGQGELVRAKVGSGQWTRSLKGAMLYAGVIGWWALLLACCAGVLFSYRAGLFMAGFLVLLIAPVLLQWLRKRSLTMALYSAALLNFHAAGLIAGLLRPRIDPVQPIESVIRQPRG